MTKAIWGGKGLLGLCFHLTVHHRRKSGRNSNREGTWKQELMQRPWRGAVTGLLLVACPSGFLIEPQDHQSRSGTTHNVLGRPSSITN